MDLEAGGKQGRWFREGLRGREHTNLTAFEKRYQKAAMEAMAVARRESESDDYVWLITERPEPGSEPDNNSGDDESSSDDGETVYPSSEH